jgi:hypothetical protein
MLLMLERGKSQRIKLAFRSCHMLLNSLDFCTRSSEKQNTHAGTWKKHLMEYVKINSDGAFSEANKTDADHVGSGAGHMGAAADAVQSEAVACLHAVQFASDAGIQRLELEIDCLVLK